MSDYVNFALFLLSFLVVGFFWNLAPLRKNDWFRNYLRAKGLFHMFLLVVVVGLFSMKG
jgi:hypothetical protein